MPYLVHDKTLRRCHSRSIDDLMALVEKLDGNANPPDWMVDCNERDGLLAEIQLIIYLLSQP